MDTDLWATKTWNGSTHYNLFILIGKNFEVVVTVTVFPPGGNFEVMVTVTEIGLES
jgi:hypothetical protein